VTNSHELMQAVRNLTAAGEIAKVETLLRDVISSNPGWLEPRIELSKALFARGDNDHALREALLSTRHFPGEESVWRFVAAIYFQLGDIPASRRAFLKASLLLPSSGQTLSSLGTVNLRLGEDSSKNTHFLRATLVDPFDVQAKLDHAKIVLSHLRPLALGIRLTRQAQMLAPASGEATYLAGLLYHSERSPEISMRLLRRAGLLAPRNPSVHYHLGNVAFLAGDQPLAKTALTHALTLGYAEAKVRFLLGRVFRQIGDVEASKAQLDRAVALDNQYAESRRILDWTVRAEHFLA
jgi:Flp pilus assembly protein TadD